ncbi:MAG: prefoldin subunit beta [Candidatus Diapherotrites archaeon]|nr:prefoldin subunit beta [Candidatus Diapherotrites archaeon]MDZ4256132.1 prefoldin subunit beta [archaeon]
MAQDIREKIMEFEKQRQALINVTMQKQQLQALVNGLEKSLEEIERTKETNVYKAAGNILVLREKGEVKKELADQKETSSIRLKSVEKQEESLVQKLNTLRSQIESDAAQGAAQIRSNDQTVKSSDANKP